VGDVVRATSNGELGVVLDEGTHCLVGVVYRVRFQGGCNEAVREDVEIVLPSARLELR
jgi:hypothetical protein